MSFHPNADLKIFEIIAVPFFSDCKQSDGSPPYFPPSIKVFIEWSNIYQGLIEIYEKKSFNRFRFVFLFLTSLCPRNGLALRAWPLTGLYLSLKWNSQRVLKTFLGGKGKSPTFFFQRELGSITGTLGSKNTFFCRNFWGNRVKPGGVRLFYS